MNSLIISLKNIFKTLAECFSSRRVNIGMDEAHMVGLGKYLGKHGFTNRFDIMLKHLKKVIAIAGKYGFRCAMRSDMFFRLAFGGIYQSNDNKNIPEDIIKKIPKNVDLIYWRYYSTEIEHYRAMLKKHKHIGNTTIFAGGAATWFGLAPLNSFSIARTTAAFTACREHGITDVFLTMWGDNGGSCSTSST